MDKIKLQKEVLNLVEIMEVLRGEDGCIWDKQQDYYSLKPYILEEAYEVIEALEKKDLTELQEELGDLLLQVVFQAQIGREKGDFDLVDVIKKISAKLVRRHPHVFGEDIINSIAELKATWQRIKDEEKTLLEKESILADIKQSYPSLNQAYELQAQAATVGFDWDNVEDVIIKIQEELEELKEEIKKDNNVQIENELGDLLFAVVNLSRFYKIDPEISLIKANLKFKERFNYMEKRIREDNYEFNKLSLEELDYYWEEAKRKLKKGD